MILNLFVLFLTFSLVVPEGNPSRTYSYGTRVRYDNNEDIHSCVDNEFETCNAQAIDKLQNINYAVSDFGTTTMKVSAIIIEREECLFDNTKSRNWCYESIFTNYTHVINNVSLTHNERTAYKEVVFSKLRLCKKIMNKNCRTSSFVIDTIRSCVNDAILSFHKQVYPSIKGGQSAKTDVSNALVALQQSTIESKEGLVTGMDFIRYLDLFMDRMTFCSEQINHLEAVGI